LKANNIQVRIADIGTSGNGCYRGSLKHVSPCWRDLAFGVKVLPDAEIEAAATA
jgi:hypothetical protein